MLRATRTNCPRVVGETGQSLTDILDRLDALLSGAAPLPDFGARCQELGSLLREEAARIREQAAQHHRETQAAIGGVKKNTEQIREKQDQYQESLEERLKRIEALLQVKEANAAAEPAPPPKARELPAQIGPENEPYAQALKAVTERRPEDARQFLKETLEAQDRDRARTYVTCAENEYYALRYPDAVAWYRKAAALRPDDPEILNALAVMLVRAGQYRRPSLFCGVLWRFGRRLWGRITPTPPRASTTWPCSTIVRAITPRPSRSISVLWRSGRRPWAGTPRHREQPQQPGRALRAQGNYAEAEPLYQRALAIREKALGPEHPDTAASLNNRGARSP